MKETHGFDDLTLNRVEFFFSSIQQKIPFCTFAERNFLLGGNYENIRADGIVWLRECALPHGGGGGRIPAPFQRRGRLYAAFVDAAGDSLLRFKYIAPM